YFRRIVVAISSPVKADDAVVLHQHVIRSEARELAAGEANNHQATFEGDAFSAALADFTTDWIVDHVRASAVCFSFYHIDEVLGLIVQRGVCAALPDKLELLVRTTRANDLSRAERASNLNRRQSDSSGSRVNQNRFALLERASISKSEIRRLINKRERCSF